MIMRDIEGLFNTQIGGKSVEILILIDIKI